MVLDDGCRLDARALTCPWLCRRWTSALSTVGIFLTFLFVPEPLRVPLAELDRRYAYHSAGKVYHGAFSTPSGAICLLLTLS